METVKKPSSVKVKTDEQTEKTTKTDLQQELNLKKAQLKDAEARLKGGFSPSMQRDIRSVDDELEEAKIVVEMQEIQLAKDAPLRPKYMYEQDSRWRELQKKGFRKLIENNRAHIKVLEEQKEKVEKEMPEIQNRIKELEKKLGVKPKGAKK